MALTGIGDCRGTSARPGNTALSSSTLWREVVYTRLGIAFTALIAALWLSKVGLISLGRIQSGSIRLGLEDALLIPTLAFFFFGQLVYLFCRLGFLKRTQSHRPPSRLEIESIYDHELPPPLTILVPSYCE